jgi:hypothetical protein
VSADELKTPAVTEDDGFVDLVTVALALEAIAAVCEIFGQFQTWRASRSGIRNNLPAAHGEALFRQLVRDLEELERLTDLSQRSLERVREGLRRCIDLINEADEGILSEISFLGAYKARIRHRDRHDYRDAMGDISDGLSRLLYNIQDASIVAVRFIPPLETEEIRQLAILETEETAAIRTVFEALANPDTTYGGAISMIEQLLATAAQFLVILHDEAFGLHAEIFQLAPVAAPPGEFR